MRWTKTTRCIKGGGKVVGAKEREESEVGRCSEMFLDQWRGCTTVTVCKLHHRLHLECSSSMQSPCYVLRPSVDPRYRSLRARVPALEWRAPFPYTRRPYPRRSSHSPRNFPLFPKPPLPRKVGSEVSKLCYLFLQSLP